jgi:hypothetical protein
MNPASTDALMNSAFTVSSLFDDGVHRRLAE